MKKLVIFFVILFPLLASAQEVKKDTLTARNDTLTVKKDTLTVRKDTVIVKKEVFTPKRDSASMMRKAIILSKKNADDKAKALVINESRFNITGGMGLKVIAIKDVVDYLNYYIPANVEKYQVIATAPEFFFNAEYRISENYGCKFEYGYVVKTYNLDQTIEPLYYNNITVTYSIHSPSLQLTYIIRDPGYMVKFGGGLSYNYAVFSQKLQSSKSEEAFTTSGIGLKLDAYGHTQLGSNFYMVFGLDIHAGFMGDLKNDEGKSVAPNTNINMSFVSAGLSFGLSYYF
jgi:hypothetical protein